MAPSMASATARLALTVLLPTPPLPDATAMMFLTSGQQLLGLDRLRAADHRAPGDGHFARAQLAEHGVDVALDLVLERAGRRGQLDLEGDRRLSLISTSLTMFRLTMSRPSSGSWTFLSAS